MRAFRDWSFPRVLLVSAAWLFLSLAGWLYFTLRAFWADVSEGSGGIGAVSVGISLPMLAVSVVPPILAIVAWVVITRRLKHA
jgi:hypothetical protein